MKTDFISEAYMIRFILAIAWTVFFLIISIPIIFIEWLIGFIWPHAKARSSQWIVMRAFQMLVWISGATLTVIGEENVPKDRPVLYTPNHRSIFDIIITYIRCPRQTGYVSKKEMKKVPIFSIWMLFMNCQFLDRSDLRAGLKMINRCVELVKDGTSICIFPEGTRNKTDEVDIMEFHEGSFKIAEKTGCPIVPVTINNSDQVFEAHFPKIKKAHVIIEYAPPIETAGLSREDFRRLSGEVHDIIETTYRKNKELV